MSVMALEDDAEANITHFAHRAEFLALLGTLLEELDENDDKNLDELVKPMGAIVSCASDAVADSSSINTCLSLAY
jgi:predicted house-cleaning noncanonical NTP pyrophosphatase (MazG superfamily)